jgi:polar amino acid transport system permease protein
MNVELFLRYAPRLADGVLVTAELVVFSVLIGAAIALPVALARLSGNRLLRAAAFAYGYFFRGTPLLAQVFLVYYGAGQFRAELEAIGLWSLFRDAFFCALFTFTLNTGAYQAEILRGAILAVPKVQWEAAESLGLKRPATLLRVILPQAFITALRPLGNEIILMIKASAIASVITVFDLMGVTRLAFARSFDFEVYLWAAVIYLAIVETMRRGWDRLETRLTRHLRMAP